MMRAWKTGLFAAMLSAAGLPLYIHLPRFASAELGLSLTTVGAILIGIRFFDFIQDPLLGWLVDRRPQFKQSFAFSSAFGLALGFAMLFSVTPPIRADIWMILALVILFTAYSLATILLYGQSVALAEVSGPDGHFTIAGFREAGLIIGVILAAVSPSILAQFGFDPYRGFGLFLAAFCFLAWVSTRDLWSVTRISATQLRLSQLHSAGGTFLLVLALANALPVALTSTLFLFFVEDRLGLPEQAGLFLILFFAAAGLSAPLWSAAAKRFGARRVLLPAMVLSIIAFIGAASLPAEAAIGFSLICVASGAALGADMVILPALFSERLSSADLPAGQAFGFWAFVAKIALALAALTALPFLERAGYSPGTANTPEALEALNFAYAILPCLLKLIVIAMVLRLPRKTAEIPV